MKKFLSLIVAAGFLAGVGCGDSTGTKDKDKSKPADKGGATSGTPKDKAGSPTPPKDKTDK